MKYLVEEALTHINAMVKSGVREDAALVRVAKRLGLSWDDKQEVMKRLKEQKEPKEAPNADGGGI